LSHANISRHLDHITKWAGVQKHVTPHIFRHSQITYLIQQRYNESIIKKMMWGNITTAMFSTYAHLTDVDIENEVAQKHGISKGCSIQESSSPGVLPGQNLKRERVPNWHSPSFDIQFLKRRINDHSSKIYLHATFPKQYVSFSHTLAPGMDPSRMRMPD
jgi:hypothetical protein